MFNLLLFLFQCLHYCLLKKFKLLEKIQFFFIFFPFQLYFSYWTRLNFKLLSWTYLFTFHFFIQRFILNWNLKICCIISFLSLLIFVIFFTINNGLNFFLLNEFLSKEFKILGFINEWRFELSSYKILSLVFRLLTFAAWWDLNILKFMAWIKITFLMVCLRWRWWNLGNLPLTFSMGLLSIRKSFVLNSGLVWIIGSKWHFFWL